MSEQEQTKHTKVIVGDRRLIVVDHADNKLACLSISVALQAAARVLGSMGLLSRTVEIDTERPMFDMEIVDTDAAKRGLAGILDTLHKLSKEFPGALVLADNRKEQIEVMRPIPKAEDEQESTESFIYALPQAGSIIDPRGVPLKAE